MIEEECEKALRIVLGTKELDSLHDLRFENAALRQELSIWRHGCSYPIPGRFYLPDIYLRDTLGLSGGFFTSSLDEIVIRFVESKWSPCLGGRVQFFHNFVAPISMVIDNGEVIWKSFSLRILTPDLHHLLEYDIRSPKRRFSPQVSYRVYYCCDNEDNSVQFVES